MKSPSLPVAAAQALSSRRGKCTTLASLTRWLRGGCWIKSGADRLIIGASELGGGPLGRSQPVALPLCVFRSLSLGRIGIGSFSFTLPVESETVANRSAFG